MNQDPDKKNQMEKRATITELVATSTEKDEVFFNSRTSTKSDHLSDGKQDQPDLHYESKAQINTAHADRESNKEDRAVRKVYIEDRLRSLNMLVNNSNLEPHFSDEYRRIKRPLLSNAFGKSSSLVEKGNLILVTSSIPGEGKTHTAINLALSMAQERDHTVLLVDCDVARHGTSRLLGITERPGLVDILEDDDFSVGDAILRTDIPELCLIPAGKQHDFVTELLASQRMSELVTEIGERYDDRIIIFDGPPLLPTPQTQVLTGLVGQVAFVVEAGKTPQAVVNEALDMIPEDQATGLVMNKSEGISSRNSYYYGYYGSE